MPFAIGPSTHDQVTRSAELFASEVISELRKVHLAGHHIGFNRERAHVRRVEPQIETGEIAGRHRRACEGGPRCGLPHLPLRIEEVHRGKALDAISTVVRQSAELVQEISLASKQQVRGTEGVANAMQIISNITRQTSQGARQTARTVENMVKLSEQLNEALSQFRISGGSSSSANVMEMSAGRR